MSTILTSRGEYFNLAEPEQNTIHVVDIAHALSHVCRFGGHCRQFYSVAQHSVLVSHNVPSGYELHALLHDASEAYLGDMVKPLKDMMPEYAALERRLERHIFRQFDLPEELPACIHHADRVLLGTEQRDVMSNRDNWVAAGEPLPDVVVPWSPVQARVAFLERFMELT